VIEQRVTAQRRFADLDPDFATITGLAVHYSLLCMAAMFEGSKTHRAQGRRRIIMVGEVLQL
jgi:hypothetical protein